MKDWYTIYIMSHTHAHSTKSGEKNIITAFFLNLFFVVLEFVGGLYTNSYAILSDALHDLGDTMSLAMAWYLEKVAKKDTSKTFSFGYRRFSLLSALINNLILLIGSVFILMQVIPRLVHPHHSDGGGMFLLALVGIVVNGLAAWRMRKGKSMNEKAVSLHLLEDLYGWIVVLVAGLLIHFKDIHVIDPLLSLGLTLYILYNVFRSFVETVKIFLQGVPTNVKLGDILKDVSSLDEVKGMYEFNLWSLDGEHNVFTAHIEIEDDATAEQLFHLKSEIKHRLFTHEVDHITLEFERSSERTTAEKQRELEKIKQIYKAERQTQQRRSFFPQSRWGRIVLIGFFLALFFLAFELTPESTHDEHDPYTEEHPELLGKTIHEAEMEVHAEEE